MRRASSLIPLCSGRLGILLVLFISLHNSEWFTSTRSFSSVLGTDLSESEEARTEPIERSPSVSNDPPAPSTGYLSTLTSYFPSWWNSRVEAPGSSTTDGATIPLSASSSEVSPLPVCPLNQNLLILETMEQEPNGPSSVMWKRIVANAEEKPDNDTTPRVHVELQASMVEGEVVDEQNTDVSVSIELGTHSSATLQGDIPCQIQSIVGETLDPSLSPMNEETAFRELSRYVIEMEATVDAHPSSTCHLTEVVLSILGGVRDEQTLLESRLLSSSTALNSGFLGENNTNAIHSTRTQSYRMKKEVPVPFGAARRLRISLAFSSKETPTNDTEPTADPTAQRCGIAHFGVYLLRRERRDGHDIIPRLLEEVAMDTADVINLLKPVSGSTVLPSGEHMNILRDNHWNMASDVALGNGAPIQFRVIPSFHSPPGSVGASHLAVYFGTVETGKNEQFSASEVESASYADQISIVRTFPIPFRWEELTAHRQGYISFSGYVYMDVPAPPCVIPDANLTATLFFTNQDGSPCEQHAFEFQALDFHHQASDPTKRSVSAPDAEITDAFRTFHTTIRIPSDATQLHVALAVRGKDAVSGRTRVCFREINALVDRIAWVKDPAEKARQDATEPATDTPQQSNPELMDGKEGEGSSSARGESTLQAKENHATVDSNPTEGKRTAKRKTPPTETRASPPRPRRDPHPSSSTVPFYRKGVFKWVLSVVSFGVVLIALTLGILWGRRTRGNSSIRCFLPSYDRTKGRKPQYRVFRERKQNRPTTQSECTRKLCSEDHVVEEAIDGANPSDDDSAAEMYHEHDMYGEYDMVSEELSVTPVGSWVSSAPASYSGRGLHICTPPLIMTRPGQGEGHITTYGKGSSEHGTLEQSGTGSFRERVAVAATTLVTAMRVPRVDPNRRALLGGSHSTTTDYAPGVETLVRDNKLQRDSCLDEMHQNYFTASSLLERTEEN